MFRSGINNAATNPLGGRRLATAQPGVSKPGRSTDVRFTTTWRIVSSGKRLPFRVGGRRAFFSQPRRFSLADVADLSIAIVVGRYTDFPWVLPGGYSVARSNGL
jgi:hypothetical protein